MQYNILFLIYKLQHSLNIICDSDYGSSKQTNINIFEVEI